MNVELLGRVYERLVDAESQKWFKARMNYAISKNPFAILENMYSTEYRFYGGDIRDLSDEQYRNNNIIIYGIGKYGIHAYHILTNSDLKERIVGFADGNSQYWGTELYGMPVLSPFELCEKYKDCLVIVSSPKYGKEMYQQLARAGFPQYNLYIPRYGRIAAAMGKQYFDVFTAKENEVFIDAGCYNGMTSKQFVDWCGGNYEKIYAFEPCEDMIKECEKTFEKYGIRSVELINRACWSKAEEVGFSEDYGSMIYGSARVKENANNIVYADSIDNILDGKRATFIKMDVEGSELEALKGAKVTIQKYRPRLAISIYHKPEDIVEIPAYLLQLVPDYKFYIRHYYSDIWETIVYATV